MSRLSRALVHATIVALPFSAPTRASAALVDKEVCLASYASGQRLMRASRLRDAKKDLLVCGDEGCPSVLRKDCSDWLAEVERKMPSVVVSAHADRESTLDGAQVVIDDGAPAALDGAPIELDPGAHVIRLLRPGRPSLEASIVLKEAEQGRRVELSESASSNAPSRAGAPAAVSAAPAPTPWPAIASAGVAVVSLGAFAFFAIDGKNTQSTVLDACRGHCPESAVDDVRRSYALADVSLVVSILAAGATALLLLTRPESARPAVTSTTGQR